MAVEWWMYLVVCPLIFLAGFVDSIAGGGGVLSLPVYLLTGMPAQFAAASNKFSASSGTIVASIKYFRSNKIDVAAALVSAAFAFPGSYLGATIAMILSSNTLKIIMLVAVPLAALSVLFTKTKKKKQKIKKSKVPGWQSAKANVLRSLLVEKSFRNFSAIGELLIRSLDNALPRNACNGLFLVGRLNITLANSGFYMPAINEIRYPELPEILFGVF